MQGSVCPLLALLLAALLPALGLGEIGAVHAQPTPRHVLGERQPALTAVVTAAADLDGDGDRDVLSGGLNQVAWHENKGSGAFSDRMVITNDGDEIDRIQARDLDGDGDLDVVSRSRRHVSWHENRGGGAFSGRREIVHREFDNETETVVGRLASTVTDLNGDGLPDLVTKLEGRKAVYWRENAGEGVFADRKQLFSEKRAVRFLRSADLDGDSDADLLTWSKFNGTLALHENTSGEDSLSFSESVIDSGKDFPVLRVTDLDGDTDPDIVRFTDVGTNVLSWYQNDGSGQFSAEKTIASGFAEDVPEPSRIRTGDLEGDGDRDVLVSHGGPEEKLSWFENQGQATFSGRQILKGPKGDTYDEEGALRLARLDGDKRPDVLFAGKSGREGLFWRSNRFGGDSGFGQVRTIVPRHSASGVVSVDASDLDGDGDPDIAAATQGPTPDVLWYENEPEGFGEAQSVLAGTTDVSRPTSVEAVDLSGDGRQDILYAGTGSRAVAWHAGTGGGGFSGQKLISDTTKASVLQAVAAGDVDGDGDPDVVATFVGFSELKNNAVFWYENKGGGAFGKRHQVKRFADLPESVDVADLDGDGDGDPVVASDATATVDWYENVQAGFIGHTIASNAADPQSVYAGDLDGDGDPDVVYGSKNDAVSGNSGAVVWCRNDGTGRFPVQPTLAKNVAKTHSVFAADVSGDGKTDIIAGIGRGTSGDGRVEWYRQSAVGDSAAFSTSRVLDRRRGRAVRAADVTGDGTPNVIAGVIAQSSSGSSRQIAWYEPPTRKAPIAAASQTVRASGTFGFRETGVDLRFEGIVSSGSVSVKKFSGRPADTSGISERNVSSYRFVIRAGGGLRFDSTEVRFDVKELRGFPVRTRTNPNPFRIGDPTAVQIYRRSTPGQGTFEALSTRVDSNGTQAVNDDEIVATTEGFSEFVLASNSESLPVELAGFEATLRREGSPSRGVRLTWHTASETQSAGFVVQRRRGGPSGKRTWQKVGYVESKAPGGTSEKALSYQFTDEKLPFEAGRLVYRLKQVDLDGTAHFSKSVTVALEANRLRLLGTYPNPARSQATVRYAVPTRKEVSLQLYDVLGRRVKTIERGNRQGRHKMTLNLGGLPSGTYFLRLRAGGKTRTRRLTVVK